MHTPGPWIDSPEASDAIISTHPDALAEAGSNIGYYGGFVVCESVSRRDKPLIKAAPEMLAALEEALEETESPVFGQRLIDLIAKARGE